MPQAQRPVVVFDIGGVLCHGTGRADRLAAAAGVPVERLERAYWEFRDAYDLGVPMSRYWASVLKRVDRSAEPALVYALDRIDCEAWSSIDQDAANLLARLWAAGPTIEILSNAPHRLAATVRSAGWFNLVRHGYFSCEVGVAKPEPAVYDLVATELAVDRSDIYFFDDRPVNVAAAREAGWRAHVYESPRAAAAMLEAARVL